MKKLIPEGEVSDAAAGLAGGSHNSPVFLNHPSAIDGDRSPRFTNQNGPEGGRVAQIIILSFRITPHRGIACGVLAAICFGLHGHAAAPRQADILRAGGGILVPGTVPTLFVGLVTFRHLFTILYLLHAFPRTIFCLLPRAGNLRGVCYPWRTDVG